MAKASSQKFIGRNRPPRVQIEYDVELYGSDKKVQLPFVVGVMSELAGKSHVEQLPLAERKMLEIDVDNFDSRMKAIQPRVAFRVAHTLSGRNELPVDITFESMEDFSPAAVARKVDSLNRLLEARTTLTRLLTYMDGKVGAEDLITNFLASQSLLQAFGTEAASEEAASEDDATSDGPAADAQDDSPTPDSEAIRP